MNFKSCPPLTKKDSSGFTIASKARAGFTLRRTLLRKNLVNVQAGFTLISKACVTKAQKGFTIIEVLVSITVIALIFALGFVNFRDFSRRQALIGGVRQISGELRFAQERALAGQKPDDPFCNVPNRLAGYNFRVFSSTNFVVEAVCSGGVVEVKNIDFGPSIILSTPTPNPILFKVLGEGTNIPGGTSVTLTLTQVESGNTLDITIGASGEITQE